MQRIENDDEWQNNIEIQREIEASIRRRQAVDRQQKKIQDYYRKREAETTKITQNMKSVGFYSYQVPSLTELLKQAKLSIDENGEVVVNFADKYDRALFALSLKEQFNQTRVREVIKLSMKRYNDLMGNEFAYDELVCRDDNKADSPRQQR